MVAGELLLPIIFVSVVYRRLVRLEGSSGDITVKWRTLADDPAARVGRYGVKGEDEELFGEIIFEGGCMDKYLSIPIIDVRGFFC